MSLSPPEDPDPLLEFSSEPGVAQAAATPLEPAVQPVAAPVVAQPDAPPAPPDTVLVERIEQLERAIKESRSQALALKSDVATLVRLVADIRKQPPQPQPATTPPRTTRVHTATAITGLILGLTIGVFGWRYFAGEGDVAIAPPETVVAAQALVADRQPATPVTSEPEEPSTSQAPAPTARQAQAPQAQAPAPKTRQAPQAPAPQAPQAPPAPSAPRYVGTLSIDADPGGEVFINRKSVGSTPLRLANLRAGSHMIWIERDGYRRWTRVVLVPADQVTRVSAELERIAR